MKFLSISGAARRTPPPAENNSWVAPYRSCGTVIVFVHGVLSSAQKCWSNDRTGAFWPALVHQDAGFSQAAVFLGGYYTEVDAGEYGMRDCAKELLDSLRSPASGNPAVLDHERLVFVCHSLGGIVTRYMLECWRELFQSKAVLLVLLASPSIGSQWANSLERVIELFRNRTGRELRWRSDALDDLDRRFKEMKERQIIPHLTGCEFCEQKFPRVPWTPRLLDRIVARCLPPIVNVESAARYFGDFQRIAGSDHISIAKPTDAKDRVHQLLQSVYCRFDQTYPAMLPAPPAPMEAAAAVVQDLFQCERMSLSIQIYDDGDGHNQLAFDGIRAVRSAEGAVYRLHRPWVDAGQATDYVLQYEGTSPGIFLGPDKSSVHFDPPPSPERPQALRLESLDAHSYAMDRQELCASHTAAHADLDYAQFGVRWETVDRLFFQVSFPETMSLADERPFVQSYQLLTVGGDEREVFDSALTQAASQQFFYSPLLRTAQLTVHRPPQHTAYRILWRLGGPLTSTAPPTPAQAARLSLRRQRLLALRDFFATSTAGPEAAARKAQVLELVTAVGNKVTNLLKETVATTEADAASLLDLLRHVEITLMAVDGDALRFVAGTAVSGAAFWDRRIPLGEGIAGRAARSLDAQTYDDEQAAGTVFAGVYLELEPGKRHAWLLAVPLLSEDCGSAAIGVLNVGTFDRSHARTLKVLGEDEQWQALAEWANDELLPKLLDVVSST